MAVRSALLVVVIATCASAQVAVDVQTQPADSSSHSVGLLSLEHVDDLVSSLKLDLALQKKALLAHGDDELSLRTAASKDIVSGEERGLEHKSSHADELATKEDLQRQQVKKAFIESLQLGSSTKAEVPAKFPRRKTTEAAEGELPAAANADEPDLVPPATAQPPAAPSAASSAAPPAAPDGVQPTFLRRVVHADLQPEELLAGCVLLVLVMCVTYFATEGFQSCCCECRRRETRPLLVLDFAGGIPQSTDDRTKISDLDATTGAAAEEVSLPKVGPARV